MTPDLIQRYSAPLPRYTSYPTANHFTDAVGPAEYREWLAQLPDAARLSLYLHIPYCHQLCWYCGCSTKPVRQYDRVRDYVGLLEQELQTVAALLPLRHSVTTIQWGGGSPDILLPDDIRKLAGLLKTGFQVMPDAEFGVEIDPRLLTDARAEAFAAVGVNRISIGVQDFDPEVQKAIGREQSYRETAASIALFRHHGIASINIDLVYGLPHQTAASVGRTIEQVLTLQPDRIAIFGYAHLPSRLKHQRLIDTQALPGPAERFAQAQYLDETLSASGYLKIGIDHFAQRDDTLAKRPVARNFQGYTTDQAEALIGCGASAISKLPQGYAQNAVPPNDYKERLATAGLATARGRALTQADRIRAFVIERLMCEFQFSAGDLAERYGAEADEVIALARTVVDQDTDDFLEATTDGFRISRQGRAFVRNICARFDAYLVANAADRRHAPAI